MAIDEALGRLDQGGFEYDQGDEENKAASELRKQKKLGKLKDDMAKAGEKDDKRKSFRQLTAITKNMRNLHDVPAEEVGKITKPATGQLLKTAWLALVSIVGFVPALVYINLHALAAHLFPNVICNLGEEWLPPLVSRSRFSKLASKPLGLLEKILLALTDFLFFIILLAVLAIIAVVVLILFGIILAVVGYVAPVAQDMVL